MKTYLVTITIATSRPNWYRRTVLVKAINEDAAMYKAAHGGFPASRVLHERAVEVSK